MVWNLNLEVQVGSEPIKVISYSSTDPRIGIDCVQGSHLLDIQNFDFTYVHAAATEIIRIKAFFYDSTQFFFRIANVAIFANLCHWSCRSCQALEDSCT